MCVGNKQFQLLKFFFKFRLCLPAVYIEVVYPDELKFAKVIPIYKAGSSIELSNYRPISVLFYFSNVYEKLMYNSLVSYFDNYNIFYQNQFGFRQ